MFFKQYCCCHRGHEAEDVPEGSLEFGGYLIVRLYDTVVPGRKPLAGDSLQKKKKKKGQKKVENGVCLAKTKEGSP